jgi:biotin-(acetyl-CoA carboxylase) ligase
MLATFLDFLSHRLLQSIPEAMKDWRNACAQLGRTVTLRTGTTEITGVAETLDDAGNLHLRLTDGTVQKFASGETDFPA